MDRTRYGPWRGKGKLAQKLLASFTAAIFMVAFTTGVYASPSGGKVTSGSATIKQKAQTTTITQTTDKLCIDWKSFGIGSKETVTFVQPSVDAIALNRVIGKNASAIYGKLNANGQVFLINPNGILFAPTAQVNVGGLVASTLNITNSDFLAGNYTFSGTTGSVVNKGTITAADGGYVLLYGQQVDNQGTIVANLGTIDLGAGNEITVDFVGDGLVNFRIPQPNANGNVSNSNLLQADGGKVVMSSGTATAVAGSVINNSGIIRARSIDSNNGVIRLNGGSASTVENSGTLDVSGKTASDNGGNIYLTGYDVVIQPTSSINASGATGGTLAVSTYGDLTITNPLAAGNNANVVLRADSTGTSTGTVNFTGTGAVALSGTGTTEIYYNPTSYTSPTDYSGNVSGGTLTAYMLVNNVDQLQAMNTNLAGTYALGKDIDASATAIWNSGAGFVPIGTLTNNFTGNFNGDGHIINGLTINLPTVNYVGLFGKSIGSISNIRMVAVSVTGNGNVGGLAGGNGGSINNSYSTGAVSGVDRVGGLTGENDETGKITNSYSTGTVNGNDLVGGLVGFNLGNMNNSYSTAAVNGVDHVGGLTGENGYFNGTISNSYSTGTVGGTGSYVGGLVGFNGAYITDSYSTSVVNGNNLVGGLVGRNSDLGGVITNSYSMGSVNGTGDDIGGLAGTNRGYIADSYSTGAVTGNNLVGGLVGSNDYAIVNSYSTGSVSGNYRVGGLVGLNVDSISNSYNTGTVSGQTEVGGLVGENAGSISNSYNTGAVNGNNVVGGLGGVNYGTVINSYSTATISGAINVGGLFGGNVNGGSISNSYSAGTVVGSEQQIGGLVGTNYSYNGMSATINNSYSTANVIGNDAVGGFAGVNVNPWATITNCYSTGSVNGNSQVGGFIGSNAYGARVINSYWDATTSGQTSSSGGTGLTTEQMKNQASFGSWDFTTIWDINQGTSYPYLRWQTQ